MAFQSSHRGIRAEINLTPMIDVLLVLLIIFMVTAPTRPTGLPAAVPQPASDAQAEPEESIVIDVARDRTVRINSHEVSRARLQGELARIFQFRADRAIFVHGDGELEFGAIAEVIDAARSAGVDRTALLTGRQR